MKASSKPTSTSVVSGGRRKVHTTSPDGSEMVEEYDVRSDELLLRKRRQKSVLGAQQAWQVEVGIIEEPVRNGEIREAPHNPIMIRKDATAFIEFRIRNLFDDSANYQVDIDTVSQQIVVRTANKKYYKRISIPDLTTRSMTLDKSCLKWHHANNTLCIQYAKPIELQQIEQKSRRDVAAMSFNQEGKVDAAPSECKQQ